MDNTFSPTIISAKPLNLFQRLVSNDSGVKATIFKIKYFSQINYGISFPLVFHKMIGSFISSLFRISSPPTVRKFVISIIISSINTSVFFSKFFYMSLVRLIHVISKFFKRLPEALNSSTPISRIIRSFRVITSRFYSRKSKVKFVVLGSSWSKSMSKSLVNLFHFFNQKRTHAYQNVSLFSGKLITT